MHPCHHHTALSDGDHLTHPYTDQSVQSWLIVLIGHHLDRCAQGDIHLIPVKYAVPEEDAHLPPPLPVTLPVRRLSNSIHARF